MRFISYLAILVISFLVTACGGGGGSAGSISGGTIVKPPPALATDMPSSITMAAGSTPRTFTISGGTVPYTATTNDLSIATAAISSTDATKVVITAVSAGTVQVFVRDSTGTTLTNGVTVTVPGMTTTAPSNVTIAIGPSAAQTYFINGGTKPYTATSTNTNVVAATIPSSGDRVVVQGISAGSATVFVLDSAGRSTSISVTVPTGATVAFFTTAPPALTIALGSTATFSVGGGTTPYNDPPTSTNASVATGSLSGATLNTLTLRAIASGTATIGLRDVTGATLNIAVTVPPLGSVVTTAPSPVTIAIGASPSYTISGGTGAGTYTATSSNAAIATVATGTATVVITGVAAGTSNVVVRDSAGSSTTIAVTVPASNSLALFTTAPTPVNIAAGTSTTYTIGGGSPGYTATSSSVSVATVSQPTATTMLVTGVSAGSANVLIRDTAGNSITVAVVVPVATGPALSTTAPPSLTLAVGTTRTFVVSGGTSPYTSVSANTSVATASQSGATLTIAGVNNGATSVVIQDSAGATQTIAVTVSNTQMSVNPSTVNAFIGDTVYSTISGGTGPYTIVETFPDAADVDTGLLSTSGVFTPNTSGNVLRIVVKQAVASDGILVRDSGGNSATLALTATAGTNQISLSPKALTIAETGSPSVTYSIDLKLYGASGTTQLFSNRPDLLNPAVSSVTGSAAGTTVTVNRTAACIASETVVTITAVDSLGATATSVFTITDNNSAACP